MNEFGNLLFGIGSMLTAAASITTMVNQIINSRKISELEKNTNSIKDALVKTTGEAEHAKGVIQGRSERD